MGYTKLFDSMWSGSLYGKFEASAVFMVMLSLSDAEGQVDMTHEAISGRTGWPIDFIREGIRQLEEPDERSRTPDASGRRIIRIGEDRDWGWFITNHAKYRDEMRSIERREYLKEAKRKERDKRRQQLSTGQPSSTAVNPSYAYAETDTNTEKNKKPPTAGFAVPEGLNLEAWREWQAYRKLKPASLQAAARKLAKLGDRQAEAVEHSIANGYTGLFPPRTEIGRKASIVLRTPEEIEADHANR